MTKTMRILTVIAVLMVTAVQASARLQGDLGTIAYTQGANDGGALTFYKDASCSNAITIDGTSHKSDNLISSALTDRKVYIHATPDIGYTLKGMTIDVKKGIDSNDMQAPRRSPGITDDVTVTAVEGKPGIYQFTMPDGENLKVNVSASFPAKATENVVYYDSDGGSLQSSAYVLDGTEEYLGIKGGDGSYKYVVPEGGITYSHALTLVDDVILILRDGTTMSAATISGSEKRLTIYAQSEQTGQMTAATYGCNVTLGQRFVAYSGENATAIIAAGTVDDVTTLAGRTLKPLDGNYVSINSGDFTFSGTSSATSPFTITTGTGGNETTIHYYIYKKDDTVTLTNIGNGIVNVTGTTYGAVENQPLQRTFTMPASDVALTATTVALTVTSPVTYDGTPKTPEIKQGDDVFAATNYAIAYKVGENDVTADEVKDVNTYTCTLTGLGQYVGTESMDFTINKADFYEPAQIPDITKYVPQDKSGSYTIALPALPDGATYSFTKTDENGVIDSHSYDAEKSTLTYTTNSGTTVGTSATITVESKDAPNYNDYSFTVKAIVSEYTAAYAWPEQTSIWLDADNELQWAEGGVTLDMSKLMVKKGSTTVTDYTAKVGNTTLAAGENKVVLEPGTHRILITGDDGKLDDWVEFKVIKLIEDKTAFSVSVKDCIWGLEEGDAVDTPPTNTATLLCNGQNLSYSTDTDLNEFLNAHPGLKLWFKDNDHVFGRNPVNRVFTINSLADGNIYNTHGRRESSNFNYLGSIEETHTFERLIYMPGGMGFCELKNDDEFVPASSEGGRIYYQGSVRPDLHYVETEGANGTEWALYNGNELVPEGCYFRDNLDVYYGNGSAYTTYNAGKEGEFISFYPISFVINDSPVNWNPVGLTLDPERDDAFYMDAYGVSRYFNIANDNYVIVGKDFVNINKGLIYTGDIVPKVVDGNKIQIGDFIRSVDSDPAYHTPVVCLPNATIGDLVTKESKCSHAYAKNKVGDYSYQVASCSFIIYPNSSNLVLRDVKESYMVDEDITFTVELYGPKTRGANVFLNGKWMTRLKETDLHYGVAEVVLPGQYEGTYLIDVYGDCDEYVTGHHEFTTIYVLKHDPVLTLTGKQNTAGEAFETGANIEYDPENLIVVNAVNGYNVSNTNWKWTISNTDVVTENHIVKTTVNNAPNSEDIYLNTVGLGEVTLTARFSGNDFYNPGTTSITFTVVPMAVTSPIIELVDQSTIYYDGQAKTPEVNVYYAKGKLIPADQYDVTYDNNTDASTEAKIIVKSKTGALYTFDTSSTPTEFEIQQAIVTVTELPSASAITYSQTLANSTFTGGAAKAGEVDVAGTFAWKDATAVPTLADSEATEYEVTFTPDDANYATATCKVKLKVVEAATLFAANSTNLWATFCDIYERKMPDGCTAYTISSISSTTVTLSDALTTTIPAYTPVLVRRESGELSEDITAIYNADGTVPASGYDATTGLASTSGTGWTFYGNAGNAAISADAASFIKVNEYDIKSYVLSNGTFLRVNQNTGLPAHRCLLNVSGNTNAPVLTIGDTTNIKTTDYTDKADAWYTLDGRRIANGQKPKAKGIYINKGVKVVVK